MPRIRTALINREEKASLRQYLQSRLWYWACQRHYTLSLDYAIHLLNQCPRDPLGLCVGGAVANLTGQTEFHEKCRKAESRLAFIKNVDDICDLIKGVSREEVKAWCREMTERGNAGEEVPSEERLVVTNSNSAEELQHACSQASLRASTKSLVEVLDPVDSMYGRGLYATQHVSSGSCLLIDEPFLVQSSSRNVCAQCLSMLEGEKSSRHTSTVVCPHCEKEWYCSTACQEEAWKSQHCCSCASVNPHYAKWQSGLWDSLEREKAAWMDANSAFRASLACLAVGKICATATVKQCHPLSLPGIRQLRGVATFERDTALTQVGGLSVALSSILHQPYLFMEELLSLFAVLQTNEFLMSGNIALYPILSLINHSCVPNCAAVGTVKSPTKRQLLALRDIRAGEQLFIDYNASLTSTLSYEDRKALCAQRHFTCFCTKCVRKE